MRWLGKLLILWNGLELMLWIQKTLTTGPLLCILFCTILDTDLLLLVLDLQTRDFRYLSHRFFSLYNQAVWKKVFSSLYISFCLWFFGDNLLVFVSFKYSLTVIINVYGSFHLSLHIILSHQQITPLMKLIKTNPATIQFSLLADSNLKRGTNHTPFTFGACYLILYSTEE